MTRRLAGGALACVVIALASFPGEARATPVTVSGASFVEVGLESGLTQLYGLAASGGRIYIGNNSNDTSGIPVQVFDPTLYAGAPITLSTLGPAVGDGDGISVSGGSVFVGDRDKGLRKTALAGGSSSILIPGVAINPSGSPIVVRPGDGHIFVGNFDGAAQIAEYDAAGALVRTIDVGARVETLTLDPVSGVLYYASYPSGEVRAYDPTHGTDAAVGQVGGTIDGALAFDPQSGLLFIGTANGSNPGTIVTMNPGTGAVLPFATGFQNALGVLRDPVSGDLYFLEQTALYRLGSASVSRQLGVPEPASAGLLALGALALLGSRRRARGAA